MQNKPVTDFDDILRQSFDLGREYETGLITSDQFFQKVSQRYALSLAKSDFIDAFTNLFTPIPSTFALIRQLKLRYKLGLLSNTNEWHFEHVIRKVDVYPLFDAVTLSFKVNALKPAEKIYRDIIAQLNLDPTECAYIDDLSENAEAAQRIGLHGIRYTSHNDVVAALRRLDVHI
jgi:putative hydrolase of the HAD superfamily